MGKKNNLKKGQRLTEIAAGLEAILAVAKVIIGLISGSVVLISDAIHSVSDLLSIFASWFGLKMAQKKPDERFPFGYYKAENLAVVIISGMILYAFSQMVVRGIQRFTSLSAIEVPYLALGVSLIDAMVLFFFGRYEIKIGQEINSQSLIAMGKENRTHIISSTAVFLGTLATVNQWPYLEGIITLAISGLILKIGLETAKQGIFALMDISPGRKLEKQVIQVMESIPGVEEAFDLKLRCSGPFIFGQTKVGVRGQLEVDRSHQIADEVENKVEEKFDRIDNFVVHVEPYVDEYRHLVFPIEEDLGLESPLSDKFGRAPLFMFVNLKGEEMLGSYVLENPHCQKEARVGLAVVKLLHNQRVDSLVTKELGEISFHTLKDYLIGIYRTERETIKEALQLFKQGNLDKLTRPTRQKD